MDLNMARLIPTGKASPTLARKVIRSWATAGELVYRAQQNGPDRCQLVNVSTYIPRCVYSIRKFKYYTHQRRGHHMTSSRYRAYEGSGEPRFQVPEILHKILKSRISEMLFPAFWRDIL